MDTRDKPKVGSRWVAKVNFPSLATVEIGDEVEVISHKNKEISYTNLSQGAGVPWVVEEDRWYAYFDPVPGGIFSSYSQERYPNNVDKPSHYNNSNIEAIEYIKDSLGLEGFSYHCEGTVKKYLHRFRYKGKPIEDLKKARQYLDWLIETEEEKDNV